MNRQSFSAGNKINNSNTSPALPRLKVLIVLLEANVEGALAQALTAHVQVVLPDDCALVGADAATAGALGAQGLLGVRIDESLGAHFCETVEEETGEKKSGFE